MQLVRTGILLSLLVVAQTGSAGAQAAGSAETLGDALFAAGYTKTVWVSYDDYSVRLHGEFNPAEHWLGDGATFELRYGAGSWHQKGNLVGERYSADLLEVLIHHPGNPLGLRNPGSYVVSLEDRQDAVMVSRGGSRSVWDEYLVPLAAALAPAPELVCPPFSPQVCFAP
jgi:hypothetical protein